MELGPWLSAAFSSLCQYSTKPLDALGLAGVACLNADSLSLGQVAGICQSRAVHLRAWQGLRNRCILGPCTQIPPLRSVASNHLEKAASSYLRSARHQPVQWHAWGEAAFARAQAEDKPILLDIGAVWCHWCHVMDRESYEDSEMAKIINEHFVAVKVDRDERPDVDTRYQAAVSAISGQGGWPLTAFLTPDGRPYFGGTYFPRDDRYGRPGFGRVLLTMSQVWKERRNEALESAASVMAAIEHNESFSSRSGELSPGLVDKIVTSALAQFDPRNGGFGSQPKFPHPTVLDLLLETAMNRGNPQARRGLHRDP